MKLILLSSLVLGLKHAFDADHLAAISTVVAETKSLKKSLLAGLAWGAGHTLTLLAAGLLVLAFKQELEADLVRILELASGFMLIALGFRLIVRRLPETNHSHLGKPFVIGVIHGLAGSAVLSLLVLGTVDRITSGLWFILIFGAGATVGMVALCAIMSLPFGATGRIAHINKTFADVAGIISIAIGIVTIYENWAL